MQALWILLACFMFALMNVSVKLASHDLSLAQIIFSRGLISIIAIFIWAKWNQKPLVPPSWTPHLKRNLAGCSALWLSFYAMTQLPLPLATTLNYTSPLFLGIAVIWMQRHKSINTLQVLTIFIGFIGVLTVLRPSIQQDQLIPSLLCLISGLLAALAYLQIRTMGTLGEPDWRVVFYFSVTVSSTGLIVSLISETPPLTLNNFFALLGVSLFGFIAQLALTRAFTKGSTSLSATLQYSTIVFVTILSYFIWDELPDQIALFGMLIIILSSISSTWLTARQKGKS